MSVQFRRVLGMGAQRPGIIAQVDGAYLLKWNKYTGWDCRCPTPATCSHPEEAMALLDPAVLDGWE